MIMGCTVINNHGFQTTHLCNNVRKYQFTFESPFAELEKDLLSARQLSRQKQVIGSTLNSGPQDLNPYKI